MLYTINLSSDGYILSIGHTNHDNMYLNINNIDLNYLSCYKMVNGVPVLDTEKKAEQIAKEVEEAKRLEIERLKNELASTDYMAIKYSEGWYTDEEYAPIKAQREAIRVRIRELEQ